MKTTAIKIHPSGAYVPFYLKRDANTPRKSGWTSDINEAIHFTEDEAAVAFTKYSNWFSNSYPELVPVEKPSRFELTAETVAEDLSRGVGEILPAGTTVTLYDKGVDSVIVVWGRTVYYLIEADTFDTVAKEIL